MPTIITNSHHQDGLTFMNPDADARVGRWCQAPDRPDRCYTCVDPTTLAHVPATGYREDRTPKGVTWRYGTCPRCTPDPQKGEPLR